jgi:hypothetical protein
MGLTIGIVFWVFENGLLLLAIEFRPLLCTVTCLHCTRCYVTVLQLCEQVAVRLRDGGLNEEQVQFKAQRTELEKLLRLAWTAGSGSSAHTADAPFDAISASYQQQVRISVKDSHCADDNLVLYCL